MNENQEEFLDDIKLKSVHILLKPEHSDFLKTIDDNNMSNAVRVLIEKYMHQTKMMRFEKYMLYFIFGVCIVIAVSLILPLI